MDIAITGPYGSLDRGHLRGNMSLAEEKDVAVMVFGTHEEALAQKDLYQMMKRADVLLHPWEYNGESEHRKSRLLFDLDGITDLESHLVVENVAHYWNGDGSLLPSTKQPVKSLVGLFMAHENNDVTYLSASDEDLVSYQILQPGVVKGISYLQVEDSEDHMLNQGASMVTHTAGLRYFLRRLWALVPSENTRFNYELCSFYEYIRDHRDDANLYEVLFLHPLLMMDIERMNLLHKYCEWEGQDDYHFTSALNFLQSQGHQATYTDWHRRVKFVSERELGWNDASFVRDMIDRSQGKTYPTYIRHVRNVGCHGWQRVFHPNRPTYPFARCLLSDVIQIYLRTYPDIFVHAWGVVYASGAVDDRFL